MLTHVSLFTGIGGFDLACDWLGIDTVLQCEIDPYCLKVLEKHWPNVRRIHDVREVNTAAYQSAVESLARSMANAKGTSPDLGVQSATIQGQESRAGLGGGNRTRRPFILTGGFPCQPFSCAGKRKGKADDRFLWPEMLRVVPELRPRWVLGENVAGIVSMALDDCLASLEGIGYTAWPIVIPACAVNAPHRRDRVWIMAHADGDGTQERHDGNSEQGEPGTLRSGRDCPDSQDASADADECGDKDSPNPNQARCDGKGIQGTVGNRDATNPDEQRREADDREYQSSQAQWPAECYAERGRGQWQFEPPMDRVVARIPARVDRLKCLGNAIVPQVAYEVIKAMVYA